MWSNWQLLFLGFLVNYWIKFLSKTGSYFWFEYLISWMETQKLSRVLPHLLFCFKICFRGFIHNTLMQTIFFKEDIRVICAMKEAWMLKGHKETGMGLQPTPTPPFLWLPGNPFARTTSSALHSLQVSQSHNATFAWLVVKFYIS